MKDCRVVVAQTNPRLGDLQTNLEDHLRCIEGARERADLIVFPELSLTGYFLKDQVYELGLDLESDAIARMAEHSSQVSITFGFVERAPDGRLYNSMAFLEDGALLGVHRKVHLVSYGIFDEGRDFAAGDSFHILESKYGRFGALICEDFWHVPSGYIHFLNDADVLLVPSASPARGIEAGADGLASQRTWDTLLAASATLFRTWIVYAGRVGWEDGVGFGGGSSVFDPTGTRVASLEGLEPGELESTLDDGALQRSRVETPLRRDEKPWILAGELARHLPALRNDETES